MISSVCVTSLSHNKGLLTKSITYMYFWVSHIWNLESEVSSNMRTVDKVYCKIRHKVKDNKSGVGSSNKSDVTCHNCGKRGHLKRNYKSNRNGSNGELSKTSTRKLPKWVTKKPMISDVQNLTTATMNRNKHYYKWCTYCNDGCCQILYIWKHRLLGDPFWKLSC